MHVLISFFSSFQHKEKPVPPPPEDSDADEDSSYPEIVHGKPVEGGSNGKAGKNGKKIPKGQSNKNGTASPYFPEYQASMPTQDVQGNIHEQPHKSENILNSKNKKKAKHHAGAGSKDQQSLLQNTNSTYTGMMFYVPNANGTYTLMRPIYPIYNNNGGYSMDTGTNAAANTMATNPGATTMMYPGQQAAPQPNTPNNVPNPPEPKEQGDKDNENQDQIGESPEIKDEKEAKGESKI